MGRACHEQEEEEKEEGGPEVEAAQGWQAQPAPALDVLMRRGRKLLLNILADILIACGIVLVVIYVLSWLALPFVAIWSLLH